MSAELTAFSLLENWLCFFKLLAQYTERNTQHAARDNWLCFFNFVLAVLSTQYAERVDWLCFFAAPKGRIFP
jgi:hypothetical protein